MKQLLKKVKPILPFKTLISFKKVFDFWEEMAQGGDGEEVARAQYVLKHLQNAPVLRTPFEDIEILEKYQPEIQLLLSCLFPRALQLNEIKAAGLPFEQLLFLKTERFENILAKAGEDFQLEFRDYEDKYMSAASFILASCFNVNINMSRPMIFDIRDSTSGLVRTYRGFFNADFSEILATENSPKLTKEDIKSLLDNASDIDLWKKLIPPDSFELHGFGLFTIFDITADDAMSNLKYDLIDKNAFRTDEMLLKIEGNLRKIFGIGDLRLGLSMMDGGQIHSIGRTECKSMLLSGKEAQSKEGFFCSRTEDFLINRREAMSVSDLDSIKEGQSNFLDAVRSTGIKSYLVNPLTYNDNVTGFLELGSSQANALNSVAEKKMEEIIPLFSSALERSVEDYWTNLEAIIKEKCTAIHPAVEWRFMEAAAKVYNSGKPKSEVDMEEIVFEEVHPLFGQMDISGSSRFRDEGIQHDLLIQLKLAKQVLQSAAKKENLLIYEQLSDTINNRIALLKAKLDAGDETSTLDFLKYEIDPIFEHLQTNQIVRKEIEAYYQRIDPTINMVYEGRKRYEDTVTLINEQIASYIENAQLSAQKMFPHYFEKYKTDGVEYNIYIGDTLVRDRTYHPMYLKNIRLWQLIMTCEVENLLHRIKPKFKVPLDIASLILVQHKSLAIKFRMDEKQFDVDGAYNARYEIVKKRIDKAKLQDSDERLTTPGKIAIVYSSEDERREYMEYLTFLINREYILPDVENLNLEELQGASGLRAMRVAVNYEKDTSEVQLSRQVEELINTMN